VSPPQASSSPAIRVPAAPAEASLAVPVETSSHADDTLAKQPQHGTLAPQAEDTAPSQDSYRPVLAQTGADGWLRARNGVLQRQVMLQHLTTASQYNGCLGWADLSQFESAADQPPRLLAVNLLDPNGTVQVSSAHVFVVGPLFQPRTARTSWFTVDLKLHTQRGPVAVTALVDTGCELQGLINKRFAAAWDLPLTPPS
jgi:hypothetical protein